MTIMEQTICNKLIFIKLQTNTVLKSNENIVETAAKWCSLHIYTGTGISIKSEEVLTSFVGQKFDCWIFVHYCQQLIFKLYVLVKIYWLKKS